MKKKVKQTSDVPHRSFIETTIIRNYPVTIGGYHHVYGRDQGAH